MTNINPKTIARYISEKYPESISYIVQHEHYWDDNELIEQCEDFFYYKKLNWCGCGDPETVKQVIRDYLQILYEYEEDKSDDRYENLCNRFQDRFGCKNVYGNELLLCLAYTLAAADFTEHGSSIGGAWISEEGKMFLWLLNHNEELQQEERVCCEFCEKFDFSKAKIVNEENIMTIALGICNTKFPKNEQFKDRSKFVELPCKVGDTVYLIPTYNRKPYCGVVEDEVQMIGITSRGIHIKGRNNHEFNKMYMLGKTAFLTKEEAEQALAERGENK